MVRVLFLAVALTTLGADFPVNTTPTLKEIRVARVEPGTELIEVTFYPEKGNAAKAAHYALTFVDARGKIDHKKNVQQQIPAVDEKQTNVYTVTIETSDDTNCQMTNVISVGPLIYDEQRFVFHIARSLSAENDHVFLDTARAVKIWYMYAEAQGEEEWIEWRKQHPLEFSLNAGVTAADTMSLSQRIFSSPRNLPKKPPEKVSKK